MQVQHEHSQDSDKEKEHPEDAATETTQALQRQVDELRDANLLLQEQLARKEQYIAMIAHELRGPLSPIINYAQMIIRQQHSQRSESLQRNANIIISQARRLTRLVNDLLDASHLSSGQFALMREIFDLAALAQEIVEQLRPVAPYHTFVVDVPTTPVIGNWDSGRLQQALGNLLDNAIKYSDEQTTITVHVWTTPGVAHVSVHNQGASIPSAEIGLLFRPYTRLPATIARQGSGLGLHITKSIIEAHGGTLRLEPRTDEATSEGPKGTTFSFDLPLD